LTRALSSSQVDDDGSGRCSPDGNRGKDDETVWNAARTPTAAGKSPASHTPSPRTTGSARESRTNHVNEFTGLGFDPLGRSDPKRLFFSLSLESKLFMQFFWFKRNFYLALRSSQNMLLHYHTVTLRNPYRKVLIYYVFPLERLFSDRFIRKTLVFEFLHCCTVAFRN